LLDTGHGTFHLGSPGSCWRCCWRSVLAVGILLLAVGALRFAAGAAVGCWCSAVGCWCFAVGCWRFAVGCCRCCWLLVFCCWLLGCYCWLFVGVLLLAQGAAVGCWCSAVGCCCWLLVFCCWLLECCSVVPTEEDRDRETERERDAERENESDRERQLTLKWQAQYWSRGWTKWWLLWSYFVVVWEFSSGVTLQLSCNYFRVFGKVTSTRILCFGATPKRPGQKSFCFGVRGMFKLQDVAN
jgi:hypothetical protein